MPLEDNLWGNVYIIVRDLIRLVGRGGLKGGWGGLGGDHGGGLPLGEMCYPKLFIPPSRF